MLPSKFLPLNFISTVFLSFPSLSLSSGPSLSMCPTPTPRLRGLCQCRSRLSLCVSRERWSGERWPGERRFRFSLCVSRECWPGERWPRERRLRLSMCVSRECWSEVPPSCLPFLSPNTALFTALTKSFSTVGSSSVLNSGKISSNIESISSFLAKFKGVFVPVSFTFSSFLPMYFSSILASAFLYSSLIDANSSLASVCIFSAFCLAEIIFLVKVVFANSASVLSLRFDSCCSVTFVFLAVSVIYLLTSAIILLLFSTVCVSSSISLFNLSNIVSVCVVSSLPLRLIKL